MTREDYATTQRMLGYIEGLVSNCGTTVCDGVITAINTIDEIIDKEMEIKTKRSDNNAESL